MARAPIGLSSVSNPRYDSRNRGEGNMRRALIAVGGVAVIAIAGLVMYSLTIKSGTVKGDGITLSITRNGAQTTIVSGWPYRDNIKYSGTCELDISDITPNGTVMISNSMVPLEMGGLTLATGKGTGSMPATPIISAQTPPKPGDGGFIIDSAGCLWRFPKALNFVLRGIKFSAREGAEIRFQDHVVLTGVDIGG